MQNYIINIMCQNDEMKYYSVFVVKAMTEEHAKTLARQAAIASVIFVEVKHLEDNQVIQIN